MTPPLVICSGSRQRFVILSGLLFSILGELKPLRVGSVAGLPLQLIYHLARHLNGLLCANQDEEPGPRMELKVWRFLCTQGPHFESL